MSPNEVEGEQTKPSRARIVVVIFFFFLPFSTLFNNYSQYTYNKKYYYKDNYSYTRNANSERAFKLRKVELTSYA